MLGIQAYYKTTCRLMELVESGAK